MRWTIPCRPICEKVIIAIIIKVNNNVVVNEATIANTFKR